MIRKLAYIVPSIEERKKEKQIDTYISATHLVVPLTLYFPSPALSPRGSFPLPFFLLSSPLCVCVFEYTRFDINCVGGGGGGAFLPDCEHGVGAQSHISRVVQ